MLFQKKSTYVLGLGAVLLSHVTLAQSENALSDAELTGNIAVVTQYIYRGGVENADPTLQGGLTYAHNSGLFVGYWGSTLDYDSKGRDHGSEHDFSIGFAKDINHNWSYSSQVIAYVYQNGGHSYNDDRTERRSTTGYDFVNNLSYKNLNLGLSISLADANYGNAGDVYLTAAHRYALPYDFSLNSSIGASLYNDRGDDSIIQTAQEFNVSELRLGISKALFDSAIEMNLDYIWGGRDRYDEKLDEHLVYGVTYSF